MLKKCAIAAGVTGFLAVAQVASAGPLTLSVLNGGWSGASAPQGVCIDYDNRGGAARDELRWGGGYLQTDPSKIDDVPGYLSDYTTLGDACWLTSEFYDSVAAVSGYNFDPFDSTQTFPGATTPFSLGAFQHLNYPITDGIESVTYQLNLAHNGSTPGNPFAIDINFAHNETDNDCDTGPHCSDDIVTLSVPQLTTTFMVGGSKYLFTVLGFSLTGAPGTFNSILTSPEYGTSETELWASVDLVENPEPASLILMGTGLLGIAAAARRRLKR